MPIYEFRCDECEEEFEKLVRSTSTPTEITCPSCGSKQVAKRVSSFAARSSGTVSAFGSYSTSSCSTGST